MIRNFTFNIYLSVQGQIIWTSNSNFVFFICSTNKTLIVPNNHKIIEILFVVILSFSFGRHFFRHFLH